MLSTNSLGMRRYNGILLGGHGSCGDWLELDRVAGAEGEDLCVLGQAVSEWIPCEEV